MLKSLRTGRVSGRARLVVRQRGWKRERDEGEQADDTEGVCPGSVRDRQEHEAAAECRERGSKRETGAERSQERLPGDDLVVFVSVRELPGEGEAEEQGERREQ